jgi:hypothetical protein
MLLIYSGGWGWMCLWLTINILQDYFKVYHEVYYIQIRTSQVNELHDSNFSEVGY